MLPAYAEGLAARDDHLEPGAVPEELGHTHARVGHLLEVVEYEEHVSLAQLRLEHLERRPFPGARELQVAQDRLEGGIGDAFGRQVDEEHAVPIGLHQLGRDLQGQAGLAGPAGPG